MRTMPLTAVLAMAAAAAVALAATAPAARADHLPLAGYDGSNPFECRLQPAGGSVGYEDRDADPFCVEYDKTKQNVTGFGLILFLSNEPTRVAVASDKCFYYQHDHWRGSVDQHWEQSETYNWDGGYFWDKARGVFGTYVENFTFNNMSFDPRGLPGFPDEWRPFFGWGRGGVQVREGIPVDPACVEKAEREDPYRQPDQAD